MGGAGAAIVSCLIGGIQLHWQRGRMVVSVKEMVNEHSGEGKIKRQTHNNTRHRLSVFICGFTVPNYVCACVCVRVNL